MLFYSVLLNKYNVFSFFFKFPYRKVWEHKKRPPFPMAFFLFRFVFLFPEFNDPLYKVQRQCFTVRKLDHRFTHLQRL